MSNPSVPFERIRVALILLKQILSLQRESRATCPSIKVLSGRYNTGLSLGSHYDTVRVVTTCVAGAEAIRLNIMQCMRVKRLLGGPRWHFT
jgi:hypothetical protein